MSEALAATSTTAHLVQMLHSTTARAHVSAAGSKGGRTAKLSAAPAAAVTPGQASDRRHFSILLDLGPDTTPRAAVGDKGYDSKANREAARSRGICPVIPTKTNAKNQPAFFPKALYRARARIEQCVGKLKRFKRIALR